MHTIQFRRINFLSEISIARSIYNQNAIRKYILQNYNYPGLSKAKGKIFHGSLQRSEKHSTGIEVVSKNALHCIRSQNWIKNGRKIRLLHTSHIFTENNCLKLLLVMPDA